MLGLSFLQWWYGAGWVDVARRLLGKIKRTYLSFSVPLLLSTLFKPWRQVVAARDPNAVIAQRFRNLLDNLVSRFIGFWVRLLTIAAALVSTLMLGAIGALGLVAWPLMPTGVLWLTLRAFGWL